MRPPSFHCPLRLAQSRTLPTSERMRKAGERTGWWVDEFNGWGGDIWTGKIWVQKRELGVAKERLVSESEPEVPAE